MAKNRDKGKNKDPKKRGSRSDPSVFNAPPFMSYDPGLDAELRATQRGLEDIEEDFLLNRRRDRTDWRTERKDIKLDKRRGLKDLRIDQRRGQREFREERQDIGIAGRRGEEDFRNRLADLFRSYGVKSNVQAQSANAAGVATGGTLAAAAEARARNQALDRQPLDLARERQKEDIETSLGRLSADQREFGQDIRISKRRLKQDTAHDLLLGKRGFKRGRKDEFIARDRARREAAIAKGDLTQQMIYQARSLKPGAFGKYGPSKKGNGGSGGGGNKNNRGGGKNPRRRNNGRRAGGGMRVNG